MSGRQSSSWRKTRGFSRRSILTGPIVPEEVSRRGRRPKNPLAKAAAAAAAANSAASALTLNPLLTNGLMSGVDLTSLQAFQQNLQSLQSLQLTAGLMGLPSDTNNLAAVFPMMLSGMAGLPNLLGVSGLLGKEEAASAEDQVKENSSVGPEQSGSKAPAHTSDTKGERTEASSMTPPSTSNSTASQSSAVAPVASANSLSLNPLLLSSMLYPGMLLTPGLNLPVSATQPQGANTHRVPTAASTAPQTTKHPAAMKDNVEKTNRALEETLEEEEEEDEEEESAEQKDNSGPEGSGKAESSSSESGSSSSSDDSDSSDED